MIMPQVEMGRALYLDADADRRGARGRPRSGRSGTGPARRPALYEPAARLAGDRRLDLGAEAVAPGRCDRSSDAIAAAARQWKVDPASCRAQKGEVIHVPTGRRAPYGGLVEIAATLPAPTDVGILKSERVRADQQTDQAARYSIKVWGEGALASTRRCRACDRHRRRLPGAEAASSGASATSAAKKIAECANDRTAQRRAVAVVADHMWAAKQGGGAHDRLGRRHERHALDRRDREPCGYRLAALRCRLLRARTTACPKGHQPYRDDRIQAVYRMPYLAHATP